MQIILKNLQKKIPIPQARIHQVTQATFKKLKLNFTELVVVFVGVSRMRRINNQYLKHDYVTDVLTFALGDKAGEIIICPQVAALHAKEYKNSIQEEIVLYVIHGILHLAGYDDHSLKDIAKMRQMEKKLLQ